ncbi:MAG: universal stress protein, partial [Actinomycetota bacterium]
DGSERAEKAAAFAIDLAKESSASLEFLYVVDEGSPAFAFEIESGVTPAIKELADSLNSAAEGFVNKLKEQADAAGVQAETKVANGHPSEEILAECERSGAVQIVMASHGRRALAAAVIGSITLNVIHGSKVPVTVVPGE